MLTKAVISYRLRVSSNSTCDGNRTPYASVPEERIEGSVDWCPRALARDAARVVPSV